MPIGRYRVDAELPGFKSGSVTDITLSVADDYASRLQARGRATSPRSSPWRRRRRRRTIGGDVSGIITGEQVRELPLNGRNFLQLATLMPGVSAPDFLNVKDKGLLGGSDLSVSGGDVTANMWTVDGANNNDVGSNRTILVYPSLDAIEEFKILRNSYGPEFGGAGGAQINIVTRGGTNQLHGSGFYFGRNDAFNAKNYFLEKNDQPKEELRRHDFGGSIGGPIIKDKLHFFGSPSGTSRIAAPRAPASCRPRPNATATSAGRHPRLLAGRFRSIRSPARRSPATASRRTASARRPGDLNLYPLPNVTPAAGSCNNWVTSVTSPID